MNTINQRSNPKKKKLFRQGDVLLESIELIPKAAEFVESKGAIVLAYGEATGHHHAIRNSSARLYRDPRTQTSYVEIAESLALLEHEEHAPITLYPGIYRVVLQREYHPQEVRKVVD